ncbi:hypothetical protein J2Y63_006965 [Shinella sp. BE166]|uniref:BA14K family protein n=1 Tax=Shinella sp. BE166 TaxID=3373918 RepID=UPI003EB89CA3
MSKSIRLLSMREILTSLVLASCLLPIAAGAMRLSTDFAEPFVPHRFTDLQGENLWPPGVRKVDRSLQAYERIPAALSVRTLVAETKPVKRVKVTLGLSSKPNVVGQAESLAHRQSVSAQEWCGARYRSYDPTDNTYQPFGGGTRRPCASPAEVGKAPVREIAELGK